MIPESAIWTRAQLSDLLPLLAPFQAALGLPPAGRDPGLWIESACARGGHETESVEVWGHNLEAELRRAGPALIRMEGDRWIGLLEVRGRQAWLATSGHSRVRVDLQDFVRFLCGPQIQPFLASAGELLNGCGIDPRKGERARFLLAREQIRTTWIATLWPIRTPPGASFTEQLKEAGIPRRVAWLFLAHGGEYVLWILGWYILGSQTLQGRLDPAWLAAWALALAALVPCRLWTTWLQGSIAISAGGLLRQRLLAGILNLRSDEVRLEGAGQFLGRAIETGAIETLSLSGGLLSALAILELILTLAILATGAAAGLQAACLAFCIALTAWAARRYHRRRSLWTETRLALTHDLVERMSGHRTRLAQQSPSAWHIEEDQAAREYLERARAMDRAQATLTGLLPRLWLFASLAALAPAFVGGGADATRIAISLGGVLLGWQGFRRLTAGVANLSGAAIAWQRIAPMFHAAGRGLTQSPAAAPAIPDFRERDTILDARDLTLTYAKRTQPVLDGLNFQIRRGDWVLLEGESGGGKSTLVSVLAGLRQASGLLLAGGLDYPTLGSRAWRGLVGVSPQYHENHVLTGTFAYNLLIGRKWPAGPQEMEEAITLCGELGLGPLLERMPAGLSQMIGETGWQLSQGERSRLFLARALLQNPELVILDESFGALDPENMRQCLECVLRRAKALLVVAHP